MTEHVSLTLSFDGGLATNHEIDFYDVAQALIGFQRSLALTTHLILNDKVITHAPALKGAKLIAIPPEDGSWKFPTKLVLASTAAYQLSTAPINTPLGNLISSAYDYVISESLGFHVDYNSTLGQQYEKIKEKQPEKKIPVLDQSRFDSLIEKCDLAVKQMHRPIVESETASQAQLIFKHGRTEKPVGPPLDKNTYDYIHHTNLAETEEQIIGFISSYSANTLRGRIYVEAYNRPIPFEQIGDSKDGMSIIRIAENMSINTKARFKKGEYQYIRFSVLRVTSRSGQLKKFLVVRVWENADIYG